MRLIDATKLRDNVLFGNAYGRDTMNYYLSLIDTAATVAAVQKVRGKWIDTHKNGKAPIYFKLVCSVCDCGNDFAYNYCPECGAKMEGVRIGDIVYNY